MSYEKPIVRINNNPSLQKYYESLESRIGYQLFLWGTRHFGYYETADSWPIPVGKPLRAMEEQLFKTLQCPKGSRVLDAGCGVGHVALYMAKAGDFRVEAIDAVPHHVEKAKRNIRKAEMDHSVSASIGDYHHLEVFADESFDGIYHMETLVHSTDPLPVLKEHRRLLKPGGRIALHEYDHEDLDKAPKDLVDSMKAVSKYAAMPAYTTFEKDALKRMLEEAGFEDVKLKDISLHIVPMLWLFYLWAVIPLFFIRLFGLEHRFVNTLAGVESYRGRQLWRYTQVSARKPV